MSQFFETTATIALALVGLGLASVVVSKKSQTPQVIQASGSAFSNAMAVAESPVTGASVPINLSYPSSGLGVSDFSNGFGGFG